MLRNVSTVIMVMPDCQSRIKVPVVSDVVYEAVRTGQHPSGLADSALVSPQGPTAAIP